MSVDGGAAIQIGPAESEAVAEFLRSQQGLLAAYLFGSQARGTAGPLSDVDVALWVDPEEADRGQLERQFEIEVQLSRLLATPEVQVVTLNDASPLLVHRVLRDGALLLDADPAQRVILETKAVLRYLDTQWLREELGRGLRRRLDRGTFGRPAEH